MLWLVLIEGVSDIAGGAVPLYSSKERFCNWVRWSILSPPSLNLM